jgi:hypothetical protein
MRKLLIAVLLCTSGAAFATQGGEGGNTGCNGQGNPNSPCAGGAGGNGGNGGAGGSSKAESTNSNRNTNKQSQGQQQTAVGVGVGIGKGGKSESTSGASATGGIANSQSGASSGAASGSTLTVNEARQYRIAPDVAVSNASPTAPCRVTHAAGGSGAGFGFSIGSSTLDEGCNVREGARALFNVGLKDAAIQALCQSPVERKAMGPLCVEDVKVEAPAEAVKP